MYLKVQRENRRQKQQYRWMEQHQNQVETSTRVFDLGRQTRSTLVEGGGTRSHLQDELRVTDHLLPRTLPEPPRQQLQIQPSHLQPCVPFDQHLEVQHTDAAIFVVVDAAEDIPHVEELSFVQLSLYPLDGLLIGDDVLQDTQVEFFGLGRDLAQETDFGVAWNEGVLLLGWQEHALELEAVQFPVLPCVPLEEVVDVRQLAVEAEEIEVVLHGGRDDPPLPIQLVGLKEVAGIKVRAQVQFHLGVLNLLLEIDDVFDRLHQGQSLLLDQLTVQVQFGVHLKPPLALHTVEMTLDGPFLPMVEAIHCFGGGQQRLEPCVDERVQVLWVHVGSRQELFDDFGIGGGEQLLEAFHKNVACFGAPVDILHKQIHIDVDTFSFCQRFEFVHVDVDLFRNAGQNEADVVACPVLDESLMELHLQQEYFNTQILRLRLNEAVIGPLKSQLGDHRVPSGHKEL